MTDKELIAKIRKLNAIKPDKDWVVFIRNGILQAGKPAVPEANFFQRAHQLFFLKPAPLALAGILIIFGLFGFAEKSLPGDSLYAIKRVAENSQSFFVPEKEKPKTQLYLTEKRLEELTVIAQTNQVKKLDRALNEFSAAKIEATKEVSSAIKEKPKEEAVKIARELAAKLKIINEKEKEVLGILNIELKDEEKNQSDAAEKEIAGLLIEDLESRTLTENQAKTLKQAKENFETGNYSEALVRILEINNN